MHVTTIGLDLAKNVFQIHGIYEDGEVAFNRALRRAQVLSFFESLSHVWSALRLAAPVTIGHVRQSNWVIT